MHHHPNFLHFEVVFPQVVHHLAMKMYSYMEEYSRIRGYKKSMWGMENLEYL
jgi:hypothetical protein